MSRHATISCPFEYLVQHQHMVNRKDRLTACYQISLFPMKMVLAVIECRLTILIFEVLRTSEHSDASGRWDSGQSSAVTCFETCFDTCLLEDMDRAWACGNMYGMVVADLTLGCMGARRLPQSITATCHGNVGPGSCGNLSGGKTKQETKSQRSC
ncbi:hypothetical protein BJ741DRAFT_295223 [Chytriomyces cf. hyalinus JEL632]|nr:hypothetical protein BJ741DRAFT_295223 [Chytriomyces cf. hyalinus JEL632]